MKNKDLKPIYDSQKLNFHSGFAESMMIVNMLDSWQGLDVLEIGCGHGHLASILSYAGARVVGVDYSLEQIVSAQHTYPKLKFIQSDVASLGALIDGFQTAGGVGNPFHVVVMQGVLEHLDEPWQELDKIMENLLKPSGTCCLSVPHWVNPRGYIYHALRLLFDAKMSLTDLHYFVKGDFLKYCEANVRSQDGYRKYDESGNLTETYDPSVISYQCQFSTCDESWSSGEEMIADFRERLPNVLDGIEYKMHKIGKLLNFLTKMLPDIPSGEGACLGVKITK